MKPAPPVISTRSSTDHILIGALHRVLDHLRRVTLACFLASTACDLSAHLRLFDERVDRIAERRRVRYDQPAGLAMLYDGVNPGNVGTDDCASCAHVNRQ